MVYFTDKQRQHISKQQYVDTEIDGDVWVDVDCNPAFSYHSEESSNQIAIISFPFMRK